MICTITDTVLNVGIDDTPLVVQLGGGYTVISGGSFNGNSEEIPAGAIDGVNRVFTVAHVPNLKVFALMLNGLDLYPTDDFTLSSAVITFVQAPILGDKIQVTYTY